MNIKLMMINLLINISYEIDKSERIELSLKINEKFKEKWPQTFSTAGNYSHLQWY